MSRKPARIAALSTSAAIVAFAVSASSAAAQDPAPATAPTAGQRVGNVVDRVKQGVRGTTDSVRERLANARSSVQAHDRPVSRL